MSIRQLLTLVMIGFLIGRSGRAQSQTEQGDSKAQFSMGPRYVHMPENFFVLVRKGTNTGAIRFTKIVQDSLGNGKSAYESYFQSDGTGSFLTPNVVKRSGEIDIKPMRGVHTLAWQPGQNRLLVGKWWFGCRSPSLINMSIHFSEKDEGYEFAPTSAQSLAEIDLTDKRLRWFHYDPNARISLPVADLPK